MPRLLPSLASILILGLLTTGCAGGDGSPAPESSPTAGSATTEPASPTPGASPSPGSTAPEGEASGSIEVAAVWTGGEQEAFQKVIDAFTEQSGIQVTYTPTGSNPAAVLGPRASSDSAPDVAILPQPGLMRDFHAQGFLVPLDDGTAGKVEEHYDETWRDLATIDGELYGVFYKAANKSLVWFNPALLEEAGTEPPTSFDGFRDVATALEPSGVPLLAVAGADGWTLTDWFENIYLETAGPEKYEQLARHEIPWDDPSVVEALTLMADLLADEELLAASVEDTLQTDFPTSVAMPFRDPPEAAFVFEGDFSAGVISSETETKVGEGADFFAFPPIEEDDDAIVAAGDVAVMMRDTEGAKAFLSFLATPEAGRIWAEQGGFVSPNSGVDASAHGDDVSKRAAEMLKDAGAIAFDLSDRQPSSFGAQVGDGLYRLLQDLLQRPGEVEQIAEQLEEEAAEAYATREEAESGGEDG